MQAFDLILNFFAQNPNYLKQWQYINYMYPYSFRFKCSLISFQID